MTLTATLEMFVMALGRLSQSTTRVSWESCFGSKCGTEGGEEEYRVFWWENGRKYTTLKTGVDRRIILKWVLKKWGGKAWTVVVF
jgi:hypothetical protein